MEWLKAALLLVLGGAVGAAIVKLIDNIIMHKLNRKAKKEDDAAVDMQELDTRVKELERRSKQDFDHLKLIDRQMIHSALEMQAVMKALHALLSHSATGNASGEMKEARDNLVNFIIDNK